MQFTDAVTVAGTRRTGEGYLIADAFAVRSGVQRYAGAEVGRPELPFVDVYRPESEVRAPESLRTFSHAPVTIDHPAVAVTKDNWKELAVGEVSTDAEWNGNRIKLPLILKDAAAIDAVSGGKRGLSAGYVCDLVFGDGTTADGETYQAKQTNIRANHLAIVDAGRAGPQFRIGDGAASWGVAPITNDEKPKEAKLADTLTQVVLGDKVVNVTAADAHALDAFKASQKKVLSDAQAAHDAALATKDEEIGTLKAEKKALEDAALTPEAMSQAVADRVALETVAKIISKDVALSGVSDADVRKAVVAAKLGDEMVADASDGEITGMFKAIAKDAKPKIDPLAPALGRVVAAPATGVSDSNAAYDKMLADLASAHTGGAA